VRRSAANGATATARGTAKRNDRRGRHYGLSVRRSRGPTAATAKGTGCTAEGDDQRGGLRLRVSRSRAKQAAILSRQGGDREGRPANRRTTAAPCVRTRAERAANCGGTGCANREGDGPTRRRRLMRRARSSPNGRRLLRRVRVALPKENNDAAATSRGSSITSELRSAAGTGLARRKETPTAEAWRRVLAARLT